MNDREYAEWSAAYDWCLNHMQILKDHEPALHKWILSMERRIKARARELNLVPVEKAAMAREGKAAKSVVMSVN